MSENLFTDYPDRVASITKYLNLEELVGPLEEAFGEPHFFDSPKQAMEIYLEALAELGKFCATEIQPYAAQLDSEGVQFKNGAVIYPPKLESHMRRCTELGVFAGSTGRRYGGLNFPRPIQFMAFEIFGQACPNTALFMGACCMSDFLERFGTEQQKLTYIPKFITNEWRTAMAMTENNAGSDLGKLHTTAVKEQDHYLINGTKRFISYGNEHILFTLARSDPNSRGLSGLSVFIVPRDLNGQPNVKVTRIEDKICLHASPTCEVVFENSTGYLLGPENQGFKVIAELMNGARLGMASVALGISQAALIEAKKYALTRETMGKKIIEHPMVADMLCEMEIEIRAERALIMEAALASDWMFIYQKKKDEKNFKRWKKRYRRLTPLCKYLCSERVIVHTRNALQIFGGYGVCKEYPVERLWRESIIYPIYEGTSQIQSLMVLKDTLKDVAQQAAGFLGSLAGAWGQSMVTRDPVKSKLLQARSELNQGIKTILMAIIRDKFKSDIEALRQSKIQEFIREYSLQLLTEKTDFTYPFLYAERFTRIVCDYYALKCMADRHIPGDSERERWILEFAELALPRMHLENHTMVHRLPSTLQYIKENSTTPDRSGA